MLEKTVVISGKEVKFRSSATVPRLYRIKFKRDIFKDMAKLERSYKGKTKETVLCRVQLLTPPFACLMLWMCP